MTISTRVQLNCDIGMACTKAVVKTVEGPFAAQTIRSWSIAKGWHSYGQRDACPECWKALHSPTDPKLNERELLS